MPASPTVALPGSPSPVHLVPPSSPHVQPSLTVASPADTDIPRSPTPALSPEIHAPLPPRLQNKPAPIFTDRPQPTPDRSSFISPDTSDGAGSPDAAEVGVLLQDSIRSWTTGGEVSLDSPYPDCNAEMFQALSATNNLSSIRDELFFSVGGISAVDALIQTPISTDKDAVEIVLSSPLRTETLADLQNVSRDGVPKSIAKAANRIQEGVSDRNLRSYIDLTLSLSYFSVLSSPGIFTRLLGLEVDPDGSGDDEDISDEDPEPDDFAEIVDPTTSPVTVEGGLKMLKQYVRFYNRFAEKQLMRTFESLSVTVAEKERMLRKARQRLHRNVWKLAVGLWAQPWPERSQNMARAAEAMAQAGWDLNAGTASFLAGTEGLVDKIKWAHRLGRKTQRAARKLALYGTTVATAGLGTAMVLERLNIKPWQYYLVKTFFKHWRNTAASYVYHHVSPSTQIGALMHAALVNDNFQNTLDFGIWLLNAPDWLTNLIPAALRPPIPIPDGLVQRAYTEVRYGYSRYMVAHGIGAQYARNVLDDVGSFDFISATALRGPQARLQFEQHGDRVIEDTFRLVINPMRRLALSVKLSLQKMGELNSLGAVDIGTVRGPSAIDYNVWNNIDDLYNGRYMLQVASMEQQPLPTVDEILNTIHRVLQLPMSVETFKNHVVPATLGAPHLVAEGTRRLVATGIRNALDNFLQYLTIALVPTMMYQIANNQALIMGRRAPMIGRGGGRSKNNKRGGVSTLCRR